MRRTRDYRLHQRERIKAKRWRRIFWQWDRIEPDDRTVGRYYHTPVPCSCPMCGNPRRYFGQPTVQERRAEVAP